MVYEVLVATIYNPFLVCLLCLPSPSLHLSDFLGNVFVLLVHTCTCTYVHVYMHVGEDGAGLLSTHCYLC